MAITLKLFFFTFLLEILVRCSERTVDAALDLRVETVNSCVGKVNGSLVSLEPLQRLDGFPRFTTVYAGWNYSFNPCLAFNEPIGNPHTGFGDKCSFIAVCKYTEDNSRKFYYTLGTQNGATFGISNVKKPSGDGKPNLELVLPGISTYRHRKFRIHLVCDPSRREPEAAIFQIIEEKHRKDPIAELRHICCCPNACVNGTVIKSGSPEQSVQKGSTQTGNGTEMNTTGSPMNTTGFTLNTTGVNSVLEMAIIEEEETNGGSSKLLIIVGVNLGLLLLAGGVGVLCHAKRTHLQIYYKLPGVQSPPPLYQAASSSDQVSEAMIVPPISPSSAAFRDYEPGSKNKGKKRMLLPVLEDCLISSKDLEMGQRLGGGIFGDTHIAVWNDGHVAVKRITISIHENQLNPQTLQQLKNEVAFLSRQRHKNIVMILGLCLENKHPYVITEYVEGDCVKDFIRHRGPALVWPYRVKMTAQIADGMAFLHSMKPPILHRDLRCANLFITENDVVKVADFGLIKLIQPIREMCKEMDCCCQGYYSACPQSFRWTAPEVLENPHSSEADETIDSSCDVYSFGVVMWELVMCDDPFEELNTEQEVMEAVKQGCRPHIPNQAAIMTQYKDLMNQCWSQEADCRPTFKQVATRLKELMNPARTFQKMLNNKARLQKIQPCYDSRDKNPAPSQMV